MKKIYLIWIFFIFLISFKKINNKPNFKEIFQIILNFTINFHNENKYIMFQDYWNSLSYEEKNMIFQNIDKIKEFCINNQKNPENCKIFFDIFGIL